MDKTIEIMKEARKAGMQTACLMFGAFLVVSLLFGYYIYQTYRPMTVTSEITQTQDGANNHQELRNGETNSNS